MNRPALLTRLACLWVAAALALLSQVRAGTMDEANRAYAEGRYAACSQACQSLLAKQGWSAAVLFNLANSLMREGKVAQAVLSYERAQWLAPGDPDIAANLALARKQAGLFPEENSWIDNAAQTFSPNAWAWIASAALALLCAAILAAQAWPRKRLQFRALIAAGALALLVAGSAIFVRSQHLRRAVVMAPDVSALLSPFESAKPAFPVAAGEVLTVGRAYGSFLHVKSHDGRSGWILRGQIERVVPVS